PERVAVVRVGQGLDGEHEAAEVRAAGELERLVEPDAIIARLLFGDLEVRLVAPGARHPTVAGADLRGVVMGRIERIAGLEARALEGLGERGGEWRVSGEAGG